MPPKLSQFIFLVLYNFRKNLHHSHIYICINLWLNPFNLGSFISYLTANDA